MVFFFKKIEIFEIQNFNKIPSFTISFLYFFSIFGIFFSFHLSKLVQELWNFLYCFIRRVREFINEFWKYLKVLLKKYRNVKEIVFFKIPWFIIVFFFTFSFQFRVSVHVKKFYKFLCFFILWIRDFIKEFWKIMDYFSKKYRHLKSKILHKFHSLLFVFFNILDIFFSYFTYPKLSKNYGIFCSVLFERLEILSMNSGKFLNFY